MEYSEDHIALAAEYALGTLDADERAQVETMMAVDQDFTVIVQAWEFRLGVLNQMVGSVEPPPGLWEKISKAVGLTGLPQAPLVVPEPPPMPGTPPLSQISEAVDSLREPIAPSSPPPPPVAAPAPPPEPRAEFDFTPEFRTAPAGGDSNVVRLSDRAKAYRSLAIAMTAIAAALLAIIGVQVYSPGLLPGLGGKPATQVVEVKPSPTPAPRATSAPPSAQYVALLQGAAGGPAFILTVDGATKNFTIRKVGAPPIDANRNYELWLISDKLQNRPRSLGVIGDTNFTSRPLLAGYDSDVINTATYAVTVEQSGGSPDGAPHSQPVFIGKLIETVPAPR
jgi:anti-sigma-K factor RskA